MKTIDQVLETLNFKIMKKNQMKIRNLITGKTIIVWPSTDHPDSSYGMPQWVDKDNNSYGQCDIWEVPFGFEKVGNNSRACLEMLN